MTVNSVYSNPAQFYGISRIHCRIKVYLFKHGSAFE
jgi:hypothetical protein